MDLSFIPPEYLSAPTTYMDALTVAFGFVGAVAVALVPVKHFLGDPHPSDPPWKQRAFERLKYADQLILIVFDEIISYDI